MVIINEMGLKKKIVHQRIDSFLKKEKEETTKEKEMEGRLRVEVVMGIG